MFLSEGMGTIYSFLVELLRTTGNPLLFRIAGWAVSQFGEWLVENLAPPQMDELMQLQVMVATEAMAKDLAARFEKNPEQIYTQLMSVLYGG